jgi:hypothetical protein
VFVSVVDTGVTDANLAEMRGTWKFGVDRIGFVWGDVVDPGSADSKGISAI